MNFKETWMDKDELLRELKKLAKLGDPEMAHGEADDLLLAYIDNSEVTKAFNDIEMWYA